MRDARGFQSFGKIAVSAGWVVVGLLLSVRFFTRDRMADALDASRRQSESAAAQIRLAVEGAADELRLADPKLVKASAMLDAYWVYRAPANGAREPLALLSKASKDPVAAMALVPLEATFPALAAEAARAGLAVGTYDLGAVDQTDCHAAQWCRPVLLVALLIGRELRVGMARFEPLARALSATEATRSYLVAADGRVIAGPDPASGALVDDFARWKFFKPGPSRAALSLETSSSDGTAMLVSRVALGTGEAAIVTTTRRAAVVAASRVPVARVFLLLAALVSAAALFQLVPELFGRTYDASARRTS